MKTADYKQIADTIPHQPGVYKFIDATGEILYVGKAKDLRKRTASYFGSKRNRAYKTGVMVKSADRLEYTIVDTEQDALLLENALIKKHQPRYNVTWRDDKSYTYMCIKNERFPRVFLTRKVIRDGSVYFGPYASKARVKAILDIVKKLFPLRTCTYDLSETNIANGKFKVCLEYHIENCLGPCEGLEEEATYNERVDQVRNILKGNFREVRAHLKERMEAHAANMQFEKAQQIKEKLDLFIDYQARSTVVSHRVIDADIFHIATDKKRAYVHYLKVIRGAIIHTYTMELVKNLNRKKPLILALAIDHIREQFNSTAPEIIVPVDVPLREDGINVTVPQRGEKRALLELAEKNVKHFLFQKQRQEINRGGRQSSAERILKTLQVDLNMDEIPWHIECFDNSNIQGAHPVASCVVFRNAKPAKRDYRKYNIKTVVGANDFASMEEIVYRRYRRLLDEGESLPQLIIIDGGKGQLNAAVQSLDRLGIRDRVTIIGIAKRLEEIYFPGDSIPLYINKKSESLKLIQQARNEAHRFAITFHRQKRSKTLTSTELTNIQGIGEKTAQKLLSHFGSVKKLKQAPREEVVKLVGAKRAELLEGYFGG
ncbi:MAG: excinuclease ABC subunit UvrC [Saprospiraceae bacterium]|nr:excinuclease ABC subunit UvrC [Saprospiraceae bacterium]